MLILNRSPQKARIPTYIRFSTVRYLQLRTISLLLIEKSGVKQLVDNQSNIPLKVAKVVNAGVMRIVALERWQRLKGHRMSLIRYFGKAKIEVLC